MSKRGIDFLEKWMAEHLPNAFTDDPAAITELADQAIQAEKEGISLEEISDNPRHRCSSAVAVLCGSLTSLKANGRESGPTAEHQGMSASARRHRKSRRNISAPERFNSPVFRNQDWLGRWRYWRSISSVFRA